MPSEKLNRWLGILALLVCGTMLFIWIPLDVETGIVEKVRRQVRLGDAFAPSLAAIMIGLGGLLLLLKRTRPESNADQNTTAVDSSPTHSTPTHSSTQNHTIFGSNRLLLPSDFLHVFIVLCFSCFAVLLMRYAGPMVLYLVDGGTSEYRLLRDTVPWKYIGFIVGGLFLVVSLISYTEKRIRAVHFFVAIFIVVLLIVFYDLPFEDLLLPPNGDV